MCDIGRTGFRRSSQKLHRRPYCRPPVRGIGYSFQLAITAPRINLIGYGTATAQSWCLWLTSLYIKNTLTTYDADLSVGGNSTYVGDWLRLLWNHVLIQGPFTDGMDAKIGHLKLETCLPVPYYQKCFILYFCRHPLDVTVVLYVKTVGVSNLVLPEHALISIYVCALMLYL